MKSGGDRPPKSHDWKSWEADMSAQAQVSIDLEKIIIRGGNHPKPADGAAPEEVQACVMEMVCWLANEPGSDPPKCACPVITAPMIRVNESWPTPLVGRASCAH